MASVYDYHKLVTIRVVINLCRKLTGTYVPYFFTCELQCFCLIFLWGIYLAHSCWNRIGLVWLTKSKPKRTLFLFPLALRFTAVYIDFAAFHYLNLFSGRVWISSNVAELLMKAHLRFLRFFWRVLHFPPIKYCKIFNMNKPNHHVLTKITKWLDANSTKCSFNIFLWGTYVAASTA